MSSSMRPPSLRIRKGFEMAHSRPLSVRFEEKVERVPFMECWAWMGAKNQYGYGRIDFGGERYSGAHRVAYQLYVGAIPSDKCIDHLCRNRWCVNPLHLEVVTNRENLMRGVGVSAANAKKQVCPSGHEYSASNTYRTSQGRRHCRACHRSNQARYRREGRA